MTKRRIVDLLPAQLRSDDLRKFFSATIDHVFQSGKAEHISGFIGAYPDHFDQNKDFYKVEPTEARQFHQLSPAMVSLTGTAIDRILLYEDLVDHLRANGGIMTDQSRLFENQYYSWAPPVDLDKLNNFQCYYWFSNELGSDAKLVEQPLVRLVAPRSTYTGTGSTTSYALPAAIAGIDTDDESPAAFVDDEAVTFTRVGQNLVLTSAPAADAEVEIYRYGSLRLLVEGKAEFDPRPFLTAGTPEYALTNLTSGLRIAFNDALNREIGWDVLTWDVENWDSGSGSFYVDGVGTAIVLTTYSLEVRAASYVMMDRRASDQNPWATGNRWVHRDALSWTGEDYSAVQARRPVIEFDHRLELWRYGRTRAQDVDCVLTGNAKLVAGWDVDQFDVYEFDSLGDLSPLAIDGKAFDTVIVDNDHYLREGDRLLIAQTIDDDSVTKPLSHRIVEVQRILDEDANYVIGLSPIDSDTDGEIVRVGATGLEFYSDDGIWYLAQTFVDGEAPLFWLYDSNGVRLDDNDVYPISTFFGNRIFGYALGTGTINDDYIGQPLRRDAHGQIVFENDLHTKTYAYTLTRTPIVGYSYYRLKDDDGDTWANDWHLSATTTKQTGGTDIFSIPENLQANPDNDEVSFVSRSEWFEHFNSIMTAQDDFDGFAYAVNNWRDTAKDLSRGTKILQHRAPMLRTMLLSSDPTFNVLEAARFVEQEYIRFRARFVQKVLQFHDDGRAQGKTSAELARAVLESLRAGRTNEFPFAANLIGGARYFIPPTPAALGLTKPTTPALVVDASYGTAITMLQGHDGSRSLLFGERVEFTYEGGDKVFLLSDEIRGEATVTVEGAALAATDFEIVGRIVRVLADLEEGDVVIVQVSDIRDEALLALETMIYQSIDSTFKSEADLPFSLQAWVESKFYSYEEDRSNYTIGEFNEILKPMFLRWAQNNQLNFQANATFSEQDYFTWNFSKSTDAFGDPLPAGNWRGIFRWFFDTERPHTHPWEMLGFATRPSWWVSEYGAAPYTSNNTKLWEDLRDGVILQGPRAGTHERFARPELFQIIPVDDGGDLLDPVAAGIVPTPPSIHDAYASWKFGDGSPIEQLWRNSPSYSFAVSAAAYLMKPARWVEAGWDTLNHHTVYGDQTVHRTLLTRPTNSQLNVHGELDAGGNLRNVPGVQQWVAEHMISRGQSASILGTAVRGLGVRLAHKMAGFTSQGSLRVVADNFGLVPPEDVTVSLYSSPSKREEFYSGVIVEWTGEGYRVLGYDSSDSTFKIIPADDSGPSVTISLDGANDPVVVEWRPNVFYKIDLMVEYKGSVYRCIRGHTSTSVFEDQYWKAEPGYLTPQRLRVQKFVTTLNEVRSVPYGTVFTDLQQVADFIFGYERYLEARGWIFDHQEAETGSPVDWTSAVREFLNWAKMGWAEGNFIALSPGAERLKFNTDFGTVYSLEESTRGTYGIVNRAGMPIDRANTYVTRIDGEVSIQVKESDLFGVRLHIGDIEHVLVFSNQTIFGDTIYKPLLNLRQPRLRLVGQRASDWVGRMDAPGYVLVGDDMVANFDKAADDIRYAFEVENVDNQVLRDHARHVVGYETRSYLDNLLISDTQQFEFYQGMIHQKGAPDVFNKLLRSQFIGEDREMKFLEEWAFKIGTYGALDTTRRVSFDFRHSDYKRNPQAVRFYSDSTAPEMIHLDTADYVERPSGRGEMFKARRTYKPEKGDLPTAGFVRLDEVEHTLFRIGSISTLYGEIEVGDRVWVYEDEAFSWNVLRAFHASATGAINQITRISAPDEEEDLTTTRVYFTNPHGLVSDDVGRHIILSGPTRTEDELEGIHRIIAFGSNWVDIDASTSYGYIWTSDDEGETTAPDPENAPSVMVLRGMRFAKTSSFVAARETWLAEPAEKDRVYVDSTTGPAQAFRHNGTSWVVARTQPQKMDPSSVAEALIYATETAMQDDLLLPEPLTTRGLLVLDPVAGLVSGDAERELAFKLEYDPARYGGTSSEVWGAEQIGLLWWDISQVRFLEAETDLIQQADPDKIAAEFEYRVSNWAKIAPGTEVAVYEWVRSLVPPSAWTGEGSVYNPDRSVSYVEFDPALNRNVTVYYFWLRGSTSITPGAHSRKMPSAAVARALESPHAMDIPWVAPIAGDCVILNGVGVFLDDHSTTVQIDVRDTALEGNVHTEWTLMRDGDERSQPPAGLWSKLVDSVVGFDDRFNDVPDTTLHTSNRQGIALRPRQSLFSRPTGTPRDTILAARESMVGIINRIFARKVFPEATSSSPEPLSMADTWGTPVTEGEVTTYYMSWTAEHDEHVLPPLPREYDYEVFSVYERNRLILRSSVRNATRPIRILVNRMHDEVPNWTLWVFDPTNPALLGYSDFGLLALAEAPPAAGTQPIFTISTAYDKVVNTTVSLATLSITVGQRVLVRNPGGFWSIWMYNPNSSAAAKTGLVKGYLHLRSQNYRTDDFFTRADWYAEGYAANQPPAITYTNMNAVMLAERANPVNTFVKVTESDHDRNRWAWMAFINGSWREVAREKGTYALTSAFYDASRVAYKRSIADYSIRDGANELRRIVKELETNRNIFTELDVNEVFFNMVYFAHAHCDQINWAFKTSFLHITGYNEAMDQSPVQTSDKTAALLAYIDEVKPYRVKTRDFSRSLSPPITTATLRGTDFDKPVYPDKVTNTFRTLKNTTGSDVAILENQRPWSDWYGNAATNKIRRITSRVIFDRIDTAEVTNPLTKEKFTLPATTLQRPEHALNAVVMGAGQRITTDYEPVGEMAAKDLDTLLDLEFKGTIVDGSSILGRLPLDTYVRGTANTNAVTTSLNPYVDGLSVHGVIDPYHAANRPEELAHLSHHDTVMFKVRSNGEPGAPKQTVKIYEANSLNRTTIGPVEYFIVPFHEVAQSNQAVAIFRDGYRVPTSDYTIDHFAREVTLKAAKPSGEPTQRVSVHIFGVGGTTKIVDQRFYIYEEGQPQIFPIDEEDDVEVEIVVNGVRVGAVIGNDKKADISTSLVNLAQDDQVMLVIREMAEAGFTSSIRVFREEFSYSGSRSFILTRPPLTAEVMVVEVGGLRLVPDVDYTFDEVITMTLASHIVLTSETPISATTFRNADLMDIATVVFTGATNGEYTVTLPTEIAYMWVTVNGIRVIQGADFETTATGLKFKPGHETTDTVIVTTFMGSVCEIGHTFIAASVRPGRDILRPISDGDWDTGEWDMTDWDDGSATILAEVPTLTSPLTEYASPYAGEDRAIHHMEGGWEYVRVLESHTGLLAQDLEKTDSEIVVRKKPQSATVFNVEMFRLPQPDAPGVVWINGERVEYSHLTETSDNIVLGGVRRGTKGTKIGDEQRTVARFVGNGSTTQFLLPGATSKPIDAFSVLVVGDLEQATPLTAGVDYTVTYGATGATITMTTAPANGTYVLFTQTLTSHVHTANTAVIGASVRFVPSNSAL